MENEIGIGKLTDKEVEDFEKKTQSYVDSFKEELKRVVDEVVGEVYVDVIPHAYGDALTNFRNCMMDELVEKKPRYHEYNGTKLRQLIWEKHKSELVEMLDKDLLKENERLQNLVDAYQRGTDHFRKFN